MKLLVLLSIFIGTALSLPELESFKCDFESLPCSWKFTLRQDTIFPWRIGSSVAPNDLYKPPMDHTTLTPEGHYAYVKATGNDSLGYATLASPILPKGVFCLVYSSFARGFGSKFVATLSVHTDQSSEVLFNDFIYYSWKWSENRVTVRNDQSSYLYFQARDVGVGFTIAVDDIRVYNGTCSDLL